MLTAVLFACLPLSAAGPVKGVAGVLQPFVDSHTLAGAVTLVASKEKILSLEAAGEARRARILGKHAADRRVGRKHLEFFE